MVETSAYQFIRLEKSGGIATLVLANPEKRNALSRQTMREIIAALDEIGRDRTLKVAVLRALGPVFSSGHDL
ncbi:MAG TPA: enoyl-CoA hydratase/isomerase family protein, partial [Candidatus Baltobacteraceae bacterium]|nr:enoyl-CoA hydratase/isomerase family protein [Candidatus Baltobacteraceae bacterium]